MGAMQKLSQKSDILLGILKVVPNQTALDL